MNKVYYNKKKTNLIYMGIIFISILVMSVGYSASNINLTISGEATVMASGEVFISSMELVESVDATETFSPVFTDQSTHIGMNIESANTTFTYKVTVTNTTEEYYYLSRIDEIMNNGDIQYFIYDMYIYTDFAPDSDTVFYIVFEPNAAFVGQEMSLKLEYIIGHGEKYKDEVLAGADPVLIDGIIPIVYDDATGEWVKADVLNNQWYDYSNRKWANAAAVINSERDRYVKAVPGTIIEMNHITTMLVWIPRYSYTIKDTLGYQAYGGDPLSINTPGAINIRFGDLDILDNGTGTYTGDLPNNYYTSSAFCWGNTCDNPALRETDPGNVEIPGFWIAKFEASKTDNIIYSKPNVKPMASLNMANTFHNVQSLMNGMDGYVNYGFVGEVDAHTIKNTEWGAIAYLSQSEFGKYGNTSYTGVNKEVYINNCSTYVTGIGGDNPHSASTTASCTANTYDTYNGMGASTTGNIYGVYDMVGGTFDRVMGTILDVNGNFVPDTSGFTELPEGRYINVYPYDQYTIGDVSPIKGDALTETINYYSDRYLNDPRFSSTNYNAYHWFYRGGSLFFSNTEANGIFSYTLFSGTADPHHSSRFAITIYNYDI